MTRWRTTLAARSAAGLVLAAAVAACGGAASAPVASAPTGPGATTGPVPTASAGPTDAASSTPTGTPAASPSPSPAPFGSAAYGYTIELPGTAVAEPALRAWDGTSRIDSDGPFVDRVRLPGSVLFFVYGAPTALTLDEYAAETQRQMAEWHACPATPDSTADLALDGTPGRVHRMTCLGLFVQKLMVVRDGRGLVVNMIAPPDRVDEATRTFEELVAGMAWPG